VIINEGVKIADGTLDSLRGLARLPTRISLTFSGGGASIREMSGVVWTDTGKDSVETEVAMEKKIALLKAVTANPEDIAALHVTEPTLDDLYAHFLNARKAAQ
jgi:Cu-processing system ATP-binding protein